MYIPKVEYLADIVNLVLDTNLATPLAQTSLPFIHHTSLAPSTSNPLTHPPILAGTSLALISLLYAFIASSTLFMFYFVYTVYSQSIRLDQLEAHKKAIQGNFDVFALCMEETRNKIGAMDVMLRRDADMRTCETEDVVANHVDRTGGTGKVEDIEEKLEAILKRIHVLEREMLKRWYEYRERKADEPKPSPPNLPADIYVELLQKQVDAVRQDLLQKIEAIEQARISDRKEHLTQLRVLHAAVRAQEVNAEKGGVRDEMGGIQVEGKEECLRHDALIAFGGDGIDLSQMKRTGIPTPATSQSPPSLTSHLHDTTLPTTPTTSFKHRKVTEEEGEQERSFDVEYASLYQFLDLDHERDSSSRTNGSTSELRAAVLRDLSNTTIRTLPRAFPRPSRSQSRSQCIPTLPSSDDLLTASAPYWTQVSFSESESDSTNPFQSPTQPSKTHERIFKIRRNDPTPLPSPSHEDISSLGNFSQFQSFLPQDLASASSSTPSSNVWTPVSDTLAADMENGSSVAYEQFQPQSGSWLKCKPVGGLGIRKVDNNQAVEHWPKVNQYLPVPLGTHKRHHLLRRSPNVLLRDLPAPPSDDCFLAALGPSTSLSPSTSPSPAAVAAEGIPGRQPVMLKSKGTLKVHGPGNEGVGSPRDDFLPAKVADLFNPV